MGGRGRRHLRTWPVPVCAVLLLAGCASMPSSGEVRKVGEGDGQRADAGSQMRVFGIPPHSGESPSEIVSGFMEATTSGEADFATAKKYLTRAASQQWNPLAKIMVLTGAGRPSEDAGTSRKEGYTTVTLTGTKTATVDGKHAYWPEQGNFQTSIHLVRQNNEWRIDELQDGLVLSEQDFQRIYHSVNMYYFADLGSDVQRTGGVQKTLVADPVYLRNQLQDPLVSTVSTLLGGPTDWLSPVVTSAVPAGVRLSDKDSDHGVSIDDSQHLKVHLDAHANQFGGPRCTDFAAQLYATVQAQASAKLAAVDVLRADGSTACTLGSTEAQTYGPENLVGPATHQYYIDSDQHRLRELTADTTKADPVTGPFGANKANLDSVAVRRDEQMAAGVRSNGRQLVVSSLINDEQFHAPVVSSAVKDGLSTPSWDGFGDLWVADRNPAAPKLMVLTNGDGQPSTVTVPGLNGRIESLRVASDGVRIALVVEQNGVRTLQLGRIGRGGTLDKPEFSVTGLRPLTPPGEGVASFSWAGPSRLVVVLGSEQGGVQQIQYVSTDGSAAPALEGISEASSVAASENPSSPLLASYNGSVYRLPADGNWSQVTPKGGSPVYPG
jgi:hypothetical protein